MGGGQPGQQRNLKRMFAETPAIKPGTSSQPAPAADAAAPRKRPRPAADSGGAAASDPLLLPRSPAQLETDALLQATYGDSVDVDSPVRPPSITEQFDAAEQRRASTAPTRERGILQVGGVRVCQLRSQHTGETVTSEADGAKGLFWERAVPCQERPWEDKFPELKRVMRHLVDTGMDNLPLSARAAASGDGTSPAAASDDFGNPQVWERAGGFGSCIFRAEGRMHCICTEKVKYLHLVRHKASKTTVAVGSACVKRFVGEAAGREAAKAESQMDWQRKASEGSSKITAFSRQTGYPLSLVTSRTILTGCL